MFKRNLKTVLTATAMVGFSGLAMQASATDLPTTAYVNVVAPIGIAQNTQLSFGTVAKAAGADVTVTVTADGAGGTIASGSTPAAGLGGGEAEGNFTVTGILNATYAVTLPPADIVSAGMTLNGWNSNSANGFALTGGGGTDTLTVGATLTIPAATVNGIYNIPYNVIVEYN